MTNLFTKMFNKHTNTGTAVRVNGLKGIASELDKTVVDIRPGTTANTLVATHMDGTTETITIVTSM